MKRTLIIVALVLIISTSVIAGTLSMYVVEIDDLAEGSVVAKEFILVEGGTGTFEENVKIAPGEEVEWKFSVRNYEGEVVTETAMDLEFNVDVDKAVGKDKAIEPLVVSVEDESNSEVQVSSDGNFTDVFPLDTEGQEKIYTVKIKWPWKTEGVDDIDFAGADYGSAVKVTVTGTQKQ